MASIFGCSDCSIPVCSPGDRSFCPCWSVRTPGPVHPKAVRDDRRLRPEAPVGSAGAQSGRDPAVPPVGAVCRTRGQGPGGPAAGQRTTRRRADPAPARALPPGSEAEASASVPGPPMPELPRLPRDFGWLLRLTPGDHWVRGYRGYIEQWLSAPELLAVIEAAPRQAGRILRPLCRILGIPLPPFLRLPPRDKRASPTAAPALPDAPPGVRPGGRLPRAEPGTESLVPFTRAGPVVGRGAGSKAGRGQGSPAAYSEAGSVSADLSMPTCVYNVPDAERC